MSAFDAVSRTRRAVADPDTDRRLPEARSLSWTAITQSAALNGTMGAHAELLHGDRWQQTDGNHTESVLGNQLHTVKGNQSIVIGRNHKETLVKHCWQNIIGPHLVTNHSVRNETRMGNCDTVYGDWYVHDDAHDGRFFLADTYFKSATVMSFEVDTLFKVEIHGVHLEAAPLHIELKALKAEFDVSDNEFSVLPEETKVSGAEVNGLKDTIHGMKAKIAAADSGLAAVRQDVRLIEQEVGGLCTATKLCMHSLPHTGPFA